MILPSLREMRTCTAGLGPRNPRRRKPFAGGEIVVASTNSAINPINFASFIFREYLNTDLESDRYRGAANSDIMGRGRRSLSPSATTPERSPEKAYPLPAFQTCEWSPENEAEGETPTETTCPDPADNDPNLITGPAKPPKSNKNRAAEVDNTIAALVPTS
jgi:hypothetical protein